MTDKQKEVIKLMQSGWELGRSRRQLNASFPLPDGYKLQKGGLGKGGEVKRFRERTVCSLIELGLITPFVLNKSSLTEKGKQLKIKI